MFECGSRERRLESLGHTEHDDRCLGCTTGTVIENTHGNTAYSAESDVGIYHSGQVLAEDYRSVQNVASESCQIYAIALVQTSFFQVKKNLIRLRTCVLL